MSELELTKDGIRVEVSSAYRKLRAAQNALAYWDLACQEIILEELGEFLPRVTESGDKSGLFRKAVGGREVCKGSGTLGLKKLPRGTLKRLHDSVDRLKMRLSDSRIGPEARLVLEHFKLPDPIRMPECYRSYWKPFGSGLAILWGFERSTSDSIDAKAAIAKLPVEEWWRSWSRWIGWLFLALLCVFLLWQLLDLWSRWPRAHLTVNPNQVVVGGNVDADVSGTTGDLRELNWTGIGTPEIVTTSSLTHQYDEAGIQTVSLHVTSRWWGFELPAADATARVHVDIPVSHSQASESPVVLPPALKPKGFSARLVTAQGEFPANVSVESDVPGSVTLVDTGETVALDGKSPKSLSAIGKPGQYTVDFNPSGDDQQFKKETQLRLLPSSANGNDPVARIDVDKSKVRVGDAVSAKTSGSFDPLNSKITDKEISWDGGTNFEKVNDAPTSHTYDTPGEKKAILKITDDNGRTAQDEATIEVSGSATGSDSAKPNQTGVGSLEQLRKGGLTEPIKITLDNRVLFDSGSADLSFDGQKILKEIGQAASEQKLTIQIRGYTDALPISGTLLNKFKDNQALSDARAHAASRFLSEIIGIDQNLIHAQGFGSENAIAPNDSDEDRAKNRRIEITLTPTSSAP